MYLNIMFFLEQSQIYIYILLLISGFALFLLFITILLLWYYWDTSSTRTRRGGSCLRVRIYTRHLPSIELAGAVRQPGPRVHACFVPQWCTVPKVALEAPHFTLHSSHFGLTPHTPHFISSYLIWALLTSPQLFSPRFLSLLICHRSSSQLFSCHQSPAQPFSSHRSSSQLISALLHVRKLLLSERSLLHRKTVARRKLFAKRSFCTQKLETQMHLHRKASTNSEAFTHRKLLLREAFIDGCVYTQEAFTQRSF